MSVDGFGRTSSRTGHDRSYIGVQPCYTNDDTFHFIQCSVRTCSRRHKVSHEPVENLYQNFVLAELKTSETSWLKKQILDEVSAAPSFETSVALRNANFHSPQSPLEKHFTFSSSTWRFLCSFLSLKCLTYCECREGEPIKIERKSLLFQCRCFSSSGMPWSSFARNYRLRPISSLQPASFSTGAAI